MWSGVYNNTKCLLYARYTGMLEAVRVRREGFSFRPHFSDFFNTYRSVAYYSLDKVHTEQET